VNPVRNAGTGGAGFAFLAYKLDSGEIVYLDESRRLQLAKELEAACEMDASRIEALEKNVATLIFKVQQ